MNTLNPTTQVNYWTTVSEQSMHRKTTNSNLIKQEIPQEKP